MATSETGQALRRSTTPAGDPAWLATSYETVKALLADPRLTRSNPAPERTSRFSDSVLFGGNSDPLSDRSRHQQMRRLLTPAFSAKRMSLLRPRVRQMVEHLLDDMARRTPPVNLHEALSFPLPALVISELLGVPYEDREDFRRWSDDVGRMDDAARSQAGLAALTSYMDELIARKRKEPGVDVISDLIAASDEDPEGLPPDRVRALGAGLLFAGHETTVAAIDKGVLLLLTNAEEREAIRLQDQTAIARAVEEILRVPHPMPSRPDTFGLPRWATEDVEIEGMTIAAGELVMLAVQSANLDDGAFISPEEFDVTRESNQHLTFGFGPHFCLGAPLARMELQTVFGTLLQRFPTLRLAVPVEKLQPRTGILTGGLEELPVTW